MTYIHPERPIDQQLNPGNEWLVHSLAEHPTLGIVLEERARNIETALGYFTAEENGQPRPPAPSEHLPLSDLGAAVKELLFTFTNVEDPNDTLDNADVASFMMQWHVETEGDNSRLTERIRQFTQQANTMYIPWLQTSIPNWTDEMYQWQKFWAVYGAMHIPRESA